ncbi:MULTISPECIES: cytochrome c oxidase assembly protein [Streptomyces]|uniref:Cytochrome c oxidase assembly protein n=1 Tax=Streptomyces sudanensis TaxID=436397 RepID=A0ABY4T9Q3_9ACTN|nr:MULTISPECIES: cytochrome c oxidase assembly protein [Streptomyces]URN14774.1 cytochrome c oxidase assembly protein [Streptomyces sudanensis]
MSPGAALLVSAAGHGAGGHGTAAHGAGGFGQVAAVVALAAAAAYLLAALRLRRRGDAWPLLRDASFVAGCAAFAHAMTVPLPGGPFTAHMAHHVVTAMAAPLLMVLGRPVTLLLRALPPGRTRRGLLTAAHSRPVGWLVFPPVAALLDMGGLWLLHHSPLLAATHHHPLLNAAVQFHLPAAGLLFAFAVCRLDPVHRRWGLAVRGTTLLAAGAAHAVLAKTLYATPPPGTAFAASDLRTGAQLMYYGGDLVELALAAVLAVEWYTRRGRALRRSLPRGAAALGRLEPAAGGAGA